MRDEDLLQCPLLQGLDAMRRAELLGLLKDSNLRERLEKCMTGQLRFAGERENLSTPDLAPVSPQEESPRQSPNIHLWRRGAKD